MARRAKSTTSNRPGAAATRGSESVAPAQPTTQVRQPPSPDTPTIRSNDPVTNAAEFRLAEQTQQMNEEQQRQVQEQQEQEAKRQQELHDQRMELVRGVVQSNEGFVVLEDGNRDAVEDARVQGLVYITPVQSGPGGLEVEERVFLAAKGTDMLRTAFGENMGRK